jgi:hypothetical protein
MPLSSYSGILAELFKDVGYSTRSGTVVRRGYKSRERARDGRGASRLYSREPGSVGSAIEKKRVSEVALSLAH